MHSPKSGQGTQGIPDRETSLGIPFQYPERQKQSNMVSAAPPNLRVFFGQTLQDRLAGVSL